MLSTAEVTAHVLPDIEMHKSVKIRRIEPDAVQWQIKVKKQSTGCIKQQQQPQQQLQPVLPVEQPPSIKPPSSNFRRRMLFKFKEEHPFEQRVAESSKVREFYPDRLPIVVERLPGASVAELHKPKFLVPDSICMDQFIWILKEKLSLSEEVRIFIDSQISSPDPNASIRGIYESQKDSDGFLYIAYCEADYQLQ